MGNPGGNIENWEEQQPYIYWMTSVEGIGSRTIGKLLGYAGSPERAYALKEEDMRGVIPEKKAAALIAAKRKGDILKQYHALGQRGIRFLSIYHPDYPQRLRDIPDAPYGIYVEGSLPGEGIPAVAVIGARQCSDYGRFIAGQCGRELAMAGVNVISGMARGIDGISQQAALEAGGRTYAILGCGTDICYPAENRGIYAMAKKRGAVISEYPPGTPPISRLFPRRNRIISGLADVVLIIEARCQSGTLITADMALEQGREVYAVPGRVTDLLSQGCNKMLQQGAGLFTTVQELLEETGLLQRLASGCPPADGKKTALGPMDEKPANGESKGIGREMAGRGDAGRKILDALDFHPKDIDCLLQETGMGYRELVCGLSSLCTEGKAVCVSVGQFKKKM